MELNLQPLGDVCTVSGRAFAAGERVLSFLVRAPSNLEIQRLDVAETEHDRFNPPGVVVCRWAHAFKPRKPGENPERTLKLTAETLFLTLADPANELTPENTRLLLFLALMLERKRVVRPKGRTADGRHNVVEHVRSKQLFEIPAVELTPEFFVQVQAQLSVLVGAKSEEPVAVDGVDHASAPKLSE
ncbi:MAG: hypothetical protein KBA71_04050 [Opitutaceae bacterium]|nr:hypothetical protein [Opitutaceae bacterium]